MNEEAQPGRRPYIGCVVRVDAVTRTTSGWLVDLTHIDGHPSSYPYAPSWLFTPRWPTEEPSLGRLERVVSVEGAQYRYLSFAEPDHRVSVGATLRLQQEWTEDQYYYAVTPLPWRQEPLPFDHDHCVFTWKTIEPGELAWTPDGVTYAAEDGYLTNVINDELRLRDSAMPELTNDPDRAEYVRREGGSQHS